MSNQHDENHARPGGGEEAERPAGGEGDPVNDVRKKAAKLLARRGHAESELRRKLLQKDHPREAVETVLGELREAGTLDDLRFATHQAQLLRDKHWGPRQIRKKLSQRGVGSNDIDDALAAAGEGDTWLRGCYERARSKYGGEPGEWEDAKMKKAFRHLRHRGYRDATIRRVLFDGVVPSED